MIKVSLQIRPGGEKAGILKESRGETQAKSWKRLFVTADIPADLKFCSLYISFHGIKGGHVWLDAVQFEQAALPSTYKTKDPLEAGIYWKNPGHVVTSGYEEKQMYLKIWKEKSTKDKFFQFRVFDLYDTEVSSGNLLLSGKKTGAEKKVIDFTKGRKGIFRLWYRLTASKGAEIKTPWQEYTFAVFPKFKDEEEGPMGMFLTSSAQPLRIAQLAGVRWQNTLSASGHLGQWDKIQPKKGLFFSTQVF